MVHGDRLAAFLQLPGFSVEELRTALEVIRALEPMMPDAWDGEGGTNLIEVLSHLVERVPLSRDLATFIGRCLPPLPSVTMPRDVVIPDDPSHIDANGVIPDEHWLEVYYTGTRVPVYLLLRHSWLPDDILALAASAQQEYEATCDEVLSYVQVARDAP